MGSGSAEATRAVRLAEETFNDRYSGWERAGKPAHLWQSLAPGASSCWQCGHQKDSAYHQVPDKADVDGPKRGRTRDDDTEYDVRWVIDITAQDPVTAAREAQRIQRDCGSWATVFIVTEPGDHGAQWRVDLLDPASGPEVLRTREEAGLIAGTGLDAATGPSSPGAIARIRELLDALAGARAGTRRGQPGRRARSPGPPGRGRRRVHRRAAVSHANLDLPRLPQVRIWPVLRARSKSG